MLLVGLSRRHPVGCGCSPGCGSPPARTRSCGSCSRQLFENRTLYLLVAETFAPVAECVLFWFAFIVGLPHDRRATVRDMVAITVANLCSFGLGELIYYFSN